MLVKQLALPLLADHYPLSNVSVGIFLSSGLFMRSLNMFLTE
ncbi:hypothetical protein [Pseudanabaena cinerea]|nr:hypothetical protein [Pseudanabaena cinerea]